MTKQRKYYLEEKQLIAMALFTRMDFIEQHFLTRKDQNRELHHTYCVEYLQLKDLLCRGKAYYWTESANNIRKEQVERCEKDIEEYEKLNKNS